jgi:hypothetical protein
MPLWTKSGSPSHGKQRFPHGSRDTASANCFEAVVAGATPRSRCKCSPCTASITARFGNDRRSLSGRPPSKPPGCRSSSATRTAVRAAARYSRRRCAGKTGRQSRKPPNEVSAIFPSRTTSQHRSSTEACSSATPEPGVPAAPKARVERSRSCLPIDRSRANATESTRMTSASETSSSH